MLHSIKQGRTPKPKGRIEDLAVLPVFWKLQGKQVLLVGEGNGADWKAELMRAAGAEVIRKTDWCDADFAGMALALADAETDKEAEAFYKAAVQAGIPVNVIDKPKYCQFQFGSIVNRSPVVVSISTNGAAPILGQDIRRRIETLLPTSLQAWAKFSQSIRTGVNKRLDMGPQRRKFWEGLSRRAFGPAPDAAYKKNLNKHLLSIGAEDDSVGKVTLVGAGPGDAELLTLKAVRAMQGADVILFDDLVGDDVLDLARREAKRFLVGKRAGQRTSCKQEDINQMMIDFAKQGKSVVRLKGGDPMIFGRGGEELMALRTAQIETEVIPGITSATALSAELGMSLTHRDYAQSVRFVTGHSRHGGLPEDVDWQGLADERTTTVFYMGARMAEQIVERLISVGVSPDMPVLVAKNISRSDQELKGGKLSHLAEIVGDEASVPTLIMVGRILEQNAAFAQPDLVPGMLPHFEQQLAQRAS